MQTYDTWDSWDVQPSQPLLDPMSSPPFPGAFTSHEPQTQNTGLVDISKGKFKGGGKFGCKGGSMCKGDFGPPCGGGMKCGFKGNSMMDLGCGKNDFGFGKGCFGKGPLLGPTSKASFDGGKGMLGPGPKLTLGGGKGGPGGMNPPQPPAPNFVSAIRAPSMPPPSRPHVPLQAHLHQPLGGQLVPPAPLGGLGPGYPSAPHMAPMLPVTASGMQMALAPAPLQPHHLALPGALPGPPSSGLPHELAALSGAQLEYPVVDGRPPASPMFEKKPKLFLLITRLAPEAQEPHLQQILEQCGDVQAWRQGRGPSGEPLSFGFAQFGDPEAAWKASVCLNKRVICKQEIKVLVEEQAETLIQQWREQQKNVLKVQSDEDLEWELERKSVSCKALVDAKIEELYGPQELSGGSAQRRQELRDKEQARVERARKRKAWRMAEFSKELIDVERTEKRLRQEEIDRDNADRAREEADRAVNKDNETNIVQHDDGSGPSYPSAQALDSNTAIRDLVDRVQSESRETLFSMELDVNILRSEKTLEKKVRPWLENKIDLSMGGPQSDLVEYVLRRVNACSDPQSLISDLVRYLDDNAEPLVERMWRMLVFELMRCGGFELPGGC